MSGGAPAALVPRRGESVPAQRDRTTATQTQVVYLQGAGKYQRPTWRPSQEQKGLARGLSWHPSGPLTPGNALDAGCVDARRLPRPPHRAASHHPACSHPHGLGPRRHAEQEHLTQAGVPGATSA